MSAALARATLLLVLPLFAVGCAGSTANPCAGVTCAPGRICVWGTCQAETQDPDLLGPFPDSGWQPSVDGRRDSDSPDGAAPDRDGMQPPHEDGAVAKDKGVPPAPDSGKPDTGAPGRWYQANAQVCTTFCSNAGKTNVASPDGGLCMSGENRAASGMAQGIAFTYGCWSTCASASSVQGAASQGAYCYRPGQKDDGDPTDRTVGCFCR